nr:trithorax group protein osa-like [Penaeus vannamei]
MLLSTLLRGSKPMIARRFVNLYSLSRLEASLKTASGGVHSVYKPVPPPKPYSSSAPSAHTGGSGAGLSAEEQQQQQQQQQAGAARDQLAPVIGSALQAGPPPLLPHILVTDQGHFHTHSTKFPIEAKEAPASLFARSPPRLPAGRSATLGRGVGGGSDLTPAMGVPAKGSTLPRSTRLPSLLDLRPPAHTHTHHAHAPPHAHGTASVEDRDQLLGGDQRQPRFLDGIDNPALVDDAAHMPSYRATPGEEESTPRPPASPPRAPWPGSCPPTRSHAHTSRPSSPTTPTASRPRPSTCRPRPNTTRIPLSITLSRRRNNNNNQQQQQQPLTRGDMDEEFTRTVRWHRGDPPPAGPPPHERPPPPPPRLQRPPRQRGVNGHVHATLNGHHTNGLPAQANGHAPHERATPPRNNQNNRTGGLVDDNQANDAHERRDDARKDDKWGSLTRGLAAWKYHNLKEKISHKFSRGDKPDDRAAEAKHGAPTPRAGAKNNAENGGGGQQEQGALQPGPRATAAAPPSSTRASGGPSPERAEDQPAGDDGDEPERGGRGAAAQRPAPPLPRSPGQRSGSYHHLAQLRQDAPSWRPHHYSVDNLADAQVLPSDHTYSGPAVTGGAQPAGGEGGGSGGSDSGRGTAGSGGEGRAAHALDTSLDSAASQRQAGQGHSSGAASEFPCVNEMK